MTSSNSPTALLINEQLLKTVGVAADQATPTELMQAVSQVARQQLSERWVRTQAADREGKARRVYYLSMEFLIGRTMSNALAALDLTGPAAQGLTEHAQTLESVADREPDAALGNGGLGRLAACFLDSMATLGLPSFGYGIRYEYGMFAQEIDKGCQIEYPDPWLADGTPWEFPRAGISVPVRFGGWVEHQGHGEQAKAIWRPAGEVAAKAYDMVVPGHGTDQGQHPAPVEGRGTCPHRPGTPSTPATTAARPASRTNTKTSPGCCTRTTAPRPAANCG